MKRSTAAALAALEAGDRAAGIDIIRAIARLAKAGRQREAEALARTALLVYPSGKRAQP